MADSTQTRDMFHIMICMIKVWRPEGLADVAAPEDSARQVLYLAEASSIEISDSYASPISTAVVKVPRGTIVHKTITEYENTAAIDSTALQVSVEESGIVVATRSTTRKADQSDFRVGNRIQIWLGYTTDPRVAAFGHGISGKAIVENKDGLWSRYKAALTMMFDGYIAKCSREFPLELRCEDMAHVLRKVSCANIGKKATVSVQELFASDGKYKLLKDTGLTLHPSSASADISVSGLVINNNMTVADLLTQWAKAHLYSFIRYVDSKPCLFIGYTYMTDASTDSVMNSLGSSSTASEIDFSYHVAANNLTTVGMDKDYIAVQAQGDAAPEKDDDGNLKTGKRNRIRMTICRDFTTDGTSSGKYRILNESKVTTDEDGNPTGTGGSALTDTSGKKIDLSMYHIIPYFSKSASVTHSSLYQEAVKYFESCNPDGIDGTLTLFGDLHLQSGMKVHLSDERYPQKNGTYMVGDVTTIFSAKDGYRQKIKMPYRISRDTDETQQ